jgi:radical SAM protein with 4Fe4S-binding SPASM domain
MGVSSVLTAYCTDFVRIFSHLYDEVGARNIYMKPVNATHDKAWALNAASLPAFKAGYSALVDDILSREPDDMLARLLALNPEDYFMRFVYRVKDRAVQTYRCGAAKSGSYVDTDGQLYACAHFIGKQGWSIGDVATGVRPAIAQAFQEMTVDSRPGCNRCAARYVCGGGCHYQAVLANEDVAEPDHVKCELIRHLTKLAVRLVATLAQEHPDVLSALPCPWVLPAASAAFAADEPYVPVGRLEPAGLSSTRIGGPGRVRDGLARHACSPLLSTLSEDDIATFEMPSISWEQVDELRLWILSSTQVDSFLMRDLLVSPTSMLGDLVRVEREAAHVRVADEARFRRVPPAAARWDPTDVARVVSSESAIVIAVDLSRYRQDRSPVGLNLTVDFAAGGWTSLALHEPFILIPSVDRATSLDLRGPDELPKAPHGGRGSVWDATPAGFIPLGRWAGLQPNVC